mgnify:CR=1 FL=1
MTNGNANQYILTTGKDGEGDDLGGVRECDGDRDARRSRGWGALW